MESGKAFHSVESFIFGEEKRKNENFSFTIMWKTVFDGVRLDFQSEVEISFHNLDDHTLMFSGESPPNLCCQKEPNFSETLFMPLMIYRPMTICAALCSLQSAFCMCFIT